MLGVVLNVSKGLMLGALQSATHWDHFLWVLQAEATQGPWAKVLFAHPLNCSVA
jgi:hypothetical protein